MVAFKSLALNEEFIYDNMTWIKVMPVKSGAKCCGKVLYNAHVVGNPDIRRVFKADDEVQKIE